MNISIADSLNSCLWEGSSNARHVFDRPLRVRKSVPDLKWPMTSVMTSNGRVGIGGSMMMLSKLEITKSGRVILVNSQDRDWFGINRAPYFHVCLRSVLWSLKRFEKFE